MLNGEYGENMDMYNSFNEMAAGTGALTPKKVSAMSVFADNMTPSGWQAAVKKNLPPSEMGYEFDATRQPNGRFEIVG